MERKSQPQGKPGKEDTGRTSSQGRKLSSGGSRNKKGDPQMNEDSKSVMSEMKIRSDKPRKR